VLSLPTETATLKVSIPASVSPSWRVPAGGWRS